MRVWAVVPAAGAGTRMATDRPKQYLPLLGRTVLEHTLARLTGCARIQGVVLALAPNDQHFVDLQLPPGKPVWCVEGGTERYHSVLRGLTHLLTEHSADDWALVHDAARPCVRTADIDHLLDVVDEQGGLLATPVGDTLKRADARGRVQRTVPREDLWRALTPQVFPLGALHGALEAVATAGSAVTDEAAAMERQGYAPRLVAGSPDNIKITHPQDLPLAERILQAQARAQV